jgi:hypothetical protein
MFPRRRKERIMTTQIERQRLLRISRTLDRVNARLASLEEDLKQDRAELEMERAPRPRLALAKGGDDV